MTISVDALEILDLLPDAVLHVDQNGVIRHANNQIERVLGFHPGTLIGKTVEFLVPESAMHDHARKRKAYANHPELRPMGERRELYARTADHQQIPVDISLAPVSVEGERGVLAAIRDITVHKDRQRELERSHRDLENFASRVCDLLDPALSSLSEIVGGSQPGATELTENLEKLQSFRDALQEYARVVAAKPQQTRVDLGEVTHIAMESLRPLIETHDVKISIQKLPTVLGDKALLAAALRHMLINAVAFRNPSNRLKIKVEGGFTDGEPWVAVTDNGRGVDMGTVADPFAIFGAEDRDGAGISLAIAKKVADLHRGEMSCRSTPGKGSTFMLAFPKSDVV